jgi:hypothetical protein
LGWDKAMNVGKGVQDCPFCGGSPQPVQGCGRCGWGALDTIRQNRLLRAIQTRHAFLKFPQQTRFFEVEGVQIKEVRWGKPTLKRSPKPPVPEKNRGSPCRESKTGILTGRRRGVSEQCLPLASMPIGPLFKEIQDRIKPWQRKIQKPLFLNDDWYIQRSPIQKKRGIRGGELQKDPSPMRERKPLCSGINRVNLGLFEGTILPLSFLAPPAHPILVLPFKVPKRPQSISDHFELPP